MGTVLDGADALRGVLARVNSAARSKGARGGLARLRGRLGGDVGPTVVWLDGFARFASKLDGDGLRCFLDETEPARGKRAVPHAETAKIRLLVTIGDRDYDTLLSGDGEDGLRARRLLTHAELIRLPATNIPEGWRSPDRIEQTAYDEKGYGAVAPLKPASGLNGTFGVVSVITVVLAIALAVLAIHYGGFTPPPTLDAQASAVENALPACETPAPPTPAGFGRRRA